MPFIFATADTAYAPLAVALFIRGFGGGSITIPSAAAAYASVPRESLGHATTAINICQRFGGPVGSAGLAIFLQFALLRAAGCTLAQGFIFSKPCPAAALDFEADASVDLRQQADLPFINAQ